MGQLHDLAGQNVTLTSTACASENKVLILRNKKKACVTLTGWLGTFKTTSTLNRYNLKSPEVTYKIYNSYISHKILGFYLTRHVRRFFYQKVR